MSDCFVYMIRSGKSRKRPVKIGMAENPKRRIKELQTGNPEMLYFVLIIKCNSRRHARLLERTLHDQLCGVNVLGEWYSVNDHQLYKVLRKLAKHEDCEIVEQHNLNTVVTKEREMLRAERRRNEGRSKHIKEVESALSERKKKCQKYRMILHEYGLSHQDIDKKLKEIEV